MTVNSMVCDTSMLVHCMHVHLKMESSTLPQWPSQGWDRPGISHPIVSEAELVTLHDFF